MICFVHGGLPFVGGALLCLGLWIDRSPQHLYADPVDSVIFGTMMRWFPLEVFLAAATCALAAFLRAGLQDALRPLAAILALRTISLLVFGLSIAANLPLEASLSPPAFWRFMFYLPGLVSALTWGAPAYVAIRLLRHPASQHWLASRARSV
jgi:hypothetical protein